MTNRVTALSVILQTKINISFSGKKISINRVVLNASR
jgi:hypothetical protein